MATRSGDVNVDVINITHNNQDRRILVIYVGGTIGMMKNEEGSLSPKAGYLTTEMRNMRELMCNNEIAPFDIIEYETLLDSSDMNATDYLRIAHDIERNYDKYNGFLIAHGTDTMHYTASALSFLLSNLAKPVIITGSMISLAEAFNDARRNIVIGMMLASTQMINEVCVFFDRYLFRGNRCDKVRHNYNAFYSPNYPPLGEMRGLKFVIHERYLLPQPTGPFSVRSTMSGTVIVFEMHPGADVNSIIELLRSLTPTTTATPPPPTNNNSNSRSSSITSNFLNNSKKNKSTKNNNNSNSDNDNNSSNFVHTNTTKPTSGCSKNSNHIKQKSNNMTSTTTNTITNNATTNITFANSDHANKLKTATTSSPSRSLNALLIILDGVGNVTETNASMLRMISSAAQAHNVLVCVTAHEREGFFNSDEVQRLKEIDPYLMYCGDMTISAAELKLMYLFGCGLSTSEVRGYMPMNLRGEITTTLEPHLESQTFSL